MWAYQSNAGAWHNLRCDTRRGYVCQTYKGWWQRLLDLQRLLLTNSIEYS